MGVFPPPELPLAQKARPKRWPLWAKIATPLGALMVFGGIANACAPPEDEAKLVSPMTAVTTAEIAPTESPSTTSIGASPTTTTVAATTPPPETTTAPTPPPTAAATIPPATNPPPTNPPPTVPPPPLPIVVMTDPRFGTCKEAKANGYGPYHSGTDTEYGWYRDADSDGIVCE